MSRVRLRGLFIWAIDQDTPDHELLKGVLDPYGLGHFANRSGDDSDFTSHSSSGCAWSGMLSMLMLPLIQAVMILRISAS